MTPRKSVLALAGLSILPLLALADTVPRPKLALNLMPYNVNMRDYAFPSGLRVIFQEDHSQPIVSLTMVVDHGSTSDPIGKEGIAHVIEHLWFRSVHKGADGRDLPKVWDILRELGANLNAFTGPDNTTYLTVVPKEQLTAALRLESIRMREPAVGVTDEVLKVEREVVRNELRMRYENGGGDAYGYLFSKLYPQGHPYSRLGIGTHDSLNAITLGDIAQFTKINYGPQFSTLVVVGDFKLEDTPKLLNEFGIDQLEDPKHPGEKFDMVQNPTPRVSGAPTEPPPPAVPLYVKGEMTGLSTEHSAVKKNTLVLAWSLPSGYHDNEPELRMVASWLNFAINQELNPSWKYGTDAPLDSAGCGFDGGRIASAALCEVELGSVEEGKKVAESALNGLQYMWTTDEAYRQFQEYNFSAAKQQLMAQLFRNVDLISMIGSGRGAETAAFVHYTGDPLYYSRQFEWMNKIDAAGARKIAEKYLTRERAVAVMLVPREEGDLNLDSSNAAYRGTRRDDVLNTILTEAQLTDDLVRKSTSPPDTKKATQVTLANGMKVVVMQHSEAPLIQTALSFQGGTYGSNEQYFAMKNWDSISQIDALRIAGQYDSNVTPFTTDFYVNGSAGNLDDALYIIRDHVDQIVPDTNGKLDQAKSGKSAILKDLDDGDAVAAHIRRQHLFPDSEYSRYRTHKDWDLMKSMSNPTVSAGLASVLRPNRATLYIVGNVPDPKAAIAAATTYWGGWQGWGKVDPAAKAPATSPGPQNPAKDRKVWLVNKDNASQANVTYSCPLTTVTPETSAVAEVLGDALSESTWLALREQTGASYGAYAGARWDAGGLATLNMSGLIQNDQSPLAAKVFLELGERAMNGKIDTKTVQVVKYNRAQQYVQGHQSTEQMLNRIMSVLSAGWGLSYFDRYPDLLASVHESDWPALLKPCIGHEVVTVVGPVEVLKTMFEKTDLPWAVYDMKQAKLDYYTAMGLKPPKDDDKADASKDADKKK